MSLLYWIGRWLMGTVFVTSVRRFTKPLICIFVAQFLIAYSYYILSAVLVQYLSRNLALDDVQASVLYSAFGVMISVTGVVFGLMIDHLSVFASILMGALVAVVGRLVFLVVVPLSASDPRWTVGWSAVLLATLLPFGETAMSQAVNIGVKRYVTPPDADTERGAATPTTPQLARKGKTRSIEYGIVYVIQNIAALLAYVSISVARTAMGAHVDEAVVNRVAIGLSLPALLLAAGVAILGIFWDTHDIDLVVARREDARLSDTNIRAERLAQGKLTGVWYWWERVRPQWMSSIFVSGDTGALFVRYLVVSFALTGAKSLFRHQEATMPKYTQRVFSPTYDYALLLLVNPALVIVLTTLVQSWLAHFEALAVITAGALVCSLGAFMYMIPAEAAVYAAVVVFTLGEVIWSPRFTDYVYQLAPEGQEGAFGSVATMPLFLAKIPVGLMSGFLLEHYCPAYGSCNGVALWGIIAAFSCSSPLVLFLVYRWVTGYAPSAQHAGPGARLIVDMDYSESEPMYHLALGSKGRGERALVIDDENDADTMPLASSSTPRKYRPSAPLMAASSPGSGLH